MDRVDVLIIVALADELEAVLALGEAGSSGWSELPGQSLPVHRREIVNERGLSLCVAVGCAEQMGEVAAAALAEELTRALDPACLAMCGICAGNRVDVFLGDVIIADRVYHYDAGKHVAGADGEPGTFLHDIETYNLENTWKAHATQLARDLRDDTAFAAERPPSLAAQRRWIMERLYAAQQGDGPPPARHPDRVARCPAWKVIIKRLIAERLVALRGAELVLTDSGTEQVTEAQALEPDGPEPDPSFRVHVGALATGKAVMKDPKHFERLQHVNRTTLGVDMEAAAIGYVAQRTGRRSLIVKAVADHADHDKDDRFRAFACRVSAQVLLAFLRRCIDPIDAASQPPREQMKNHARWLPAPEPPRTQNEHVRGLYNALETAWQRRRSLQQVGGRTNDVDGDIISLRQQLREGGLKAGASLDDERYLLMERIGRGNFASVWRAFDHVAGTQVAIKVLRSDGDDSLRRERFFEGAQRMSELRSSAVVPVLEPRGEDGGYDFFVMELMDLGDLREAVTARRVSAADMLSIILHIGGALAGAHAAGLIHRDVKPANILLDRTGTPKLTDFDLVHVPDGTGRTQTGGLGSYLYAAPEQMRNAKDVTPPADVFGLGMTAVFVLHGDDLSADVLYDREAFFAALPCADAVRAVLKRAVEGRPDKRYGSVEELCAALLAASGTAAETAEQLERLLGWSDGADAVRAANRLADFHAAAGEHNGARRVLQLGVARSGGDAELRTRLMKLHRKQGAWDDVAAMLVEDARAATASDEQRKLFLEAADVRAQLKQLDAAIDLVLQAAEMSPAAQGVLPILHEAARMLGRTAETLAVLRDIIASGASEDSPTLAALRRALANAVAASNPPSPATTVAPRTTQASRTVELSLSNQFTNYSSREISVKIVYVGPSHSGVSTNLKYIYERMHPDIKGRMISLETEPRRILFFDFKPPSLGKIRGFGTRFHLYNIPYDRFYDSGRNLILKGVTGIVFVADSQPERIDANLERLEELKEWLCEGGISLDHLPLVFQYNKRDLVEVIAVEHLRAMLNPTGAPDFEAVARKGIGVFDTLKAVAKQIVTGLRKEA